MSGEGNTGAFSFTEFTNLGNFRIGISIEGIDADNRTDSCFSDVFDMVDQVGTTFATHSTFSLLYSSGIGFPGTGTGAPP